MRATFSLFQSHLDLAHSYWKQLVCEGDIVVDATCGNGKDTHFLCTLTLNSPEGIVYAFDRQENAIANTRLLIHSLLQKQLGRCILEKRCHSSFPEEIKPGTVKLIVYNLGYLPGGCKNEVTQVGTTLQSIEKAQELIMPGGSISITCYPGHPEGKKEEEAILKSISLLSPQKWSACQHCWVNRKDAPSLILLQKSGYINVDV